MIVCSIEMIKRVKEYTRKARLIREERMMVKELDKSEIAIVLQSKNILSKIGFGSDLNISKICEKVGISRKTAYEYYNKLEAQEGAEESPLSSETLQEEISELKVRLNEVELENEGLRIAKRIVEEFKKKDMI